MRFIKTAAAAVVTVAFLAPALSSAATAPTVNPKTTLYGGGATLPAIGYAGTGFFSTTPESRLSDPTNPGTAASADSLFGSYNAGVTPLKIYVPGNPTPAVLHTHPKVQYCQTGSGFGRKAITGATVNPALACPDFSVSVGGSTTTAGYSLPSGQTEPDFSASDAPLASSEYATMVTNKGATRGEPVQIPSIAGAIAFVYNNTDVATVQGTTLLNMTESQICQVFSGAINNWNGLGPYPSKPIKVVYRSDDSGTSFSFSNHISAVCPTAQPVSVSGFSTQTTFANAFVGGSAGAPAGSIGASGNPGVVSTVSSTDGAIGYAEVADEVAQAALAGSSIKHATVSVKPDVPANPATHTKAVSYSKLDPVTNFPKVFKIDPTGLVSDTVLGTNTAGGRPTLASQTPNTDTGCLLLVNPNTYATAPTKPNGDYKQYPIAAVTYLLAFQKGNGDDYAAIGALLGAAYTGAEKTAAHTVGPGTGYAFLSGIANLKVKAASCVTR